ncbi:Fe-S cluster assembly protein SufD [Gemella haemolysans]|uniref:Putative FeS assembly protein SufD n=1 Tax=Gemella haemolysans TaxID=1379 RepID=A0A133ZV97_9BACL|nr:Fe-S cluster assembly protein SufD [Gemella haemolysans]KXB59363.1 putative FeS assembly protein SufD [Gemella haemolysans]MDU3831046.1 Fe-S cluster assembly protein SufD [Gemella haemolysans]
MENNKLKLSIKTLQSIFSNTNEPTWFLNTRKLALYKSYTLPFPKLESMELERWNLFNVDFSTLRLENEGNVNIAEYGINSDDFAVVQKNNTIVHVNIPEKYADKVVIKDIFTAMNDDHVKDSFMSVVDYAESKVTAVHYTLLNAGLFIDVKDNAVIEKPLQYIVISDKEQSLFNHVTIQVGNNAKFNFIENYVNNQKEDEAPFSLVSEVVAHEGAQINYSSITNQPGEKRGTILRRGLTYRDSLINWNVAAMDEADVYHDNTTNILGDGSEANLKIVTLGVKEQKTYFNSEVVNQGLSSKGDILQHGVLLDRSHIVFNGVGFIVKGATGSNAYQSSRMLTLSSEAKADANPMLLIDENDVMAGHGASLGRIDEEQLYYLQSRGLTRKESSRLLVHGFLSPVISELTVDKIKELVTVLIDEKINNNESE